MKRRLESILFLSLAAAACAGLVALFQVREADLTARDAGVDRGSGAGDAAPALAAPARSCGGVEGTPAHRFSVRDLLDGRAVGGLRVRLTWGGDSPGASVATTDQDGCLGCDSAPASLVAEDPAWRIVAATPVPSDAVPGPGTTLAAGPTEIWAYRTRRVVAHVSWEGITEAPDAAELEFHVVGPWYANASAQSPDPWNDRWLRQAGVGQKGRFRKVRGTESLEASVPAVKGALVTGRSRSGEYEGEPVLIPFGGARDSDVHVNVLLKRVPSLAGTIVDEGGAPVADATVEFYVVRTLPAGQPLDITRERLDGRGGSGKVDPSGVLTSTRMVLARTAPDGSFRAANPYSGAVTAVLRAPGRARTVVSLGSLSETPGGVRLVVKDVAPNKASRIRLTWKGVPVSQGRYVFSDVTDVPEIACDVGVGADGYASTAELEFGRRYWVTRSTPTIGVERNFTAGGLALDRGAETIDLSTIETDVGAFLKSR